MLEKTRVPGIYEQKLSLSSFIRSFISMDGTSTHVDPCISPIEKKSFESSSNNVRTIDGSEIHKLPTPTNWWIPDFWSISSTILDCRIGRALHCTKSDLVDSGCSRGIRRITLYAPMEMEHGWHIVGLKGSLAKTYFFMYIWYLFNKGFL